MSKSRVFKSLKAALIILVMVRLMAILYYLMGGLDMPDGLTYYLFRQVIYTAAWVSILVFSYVWDSNKYGYEIQKVMMLRKCSFWAMVLCAAKFIVVFIYILQCGIAFGFRLVNNIAELAVWFILAYFFYYYWQHKKRHEAHIKSHM